MSDAGMGQVPSLNDYQRGRIVGRAEADEEITRLRAINAELVVALEPFALKADYEEGSTNHTALVLVAHLRAARAAVEKARQT